MTASPAAGAAAGAVAAADAAGAPLALEARADAVRLRFAGRPAPRGVRVARCAPTLAARRGRGVAGAWASPGPSLACLSAKRALVRGGAAAGVAPRARAPRVAAGAGVARRVRLARVRVAIFCVDENDWEECKTVNNCLAVVVLSVECK